MTEDAKDTSFRDSYTHTDSLFEKNTQHYLLHLQIQLHINTRGERTAENLVSLCKFPKETAYAHTNRSCVND